MAALAQSASGSPGIRGDELSKTAQYKEYGNAAHGLYLTHADRLDADLLAFIKS